MAQAQLHIEIKDEALLNRISRLLDNLGSLKPAMEEIGEMGLASIEKNFDQGGRPKKWKPLALGTIARRFAAKKWPGQILVVSGALKRISYEASHNKVVLSPPDLPYAAIQHFGGKAGRGLTTEIPEREYMLLQDEDEQEARDIVADHISDTR